MFEFIYLTIACWVAWEVYMYGMEQRVDLLETWEDYFILTGIVVLWPISLSIGLYIVLKEDR